MWSWGSYSKYLSSWSDDEKTTVQIIACLTPIAFIVDCLCNYPDRLPSLLMYIVLPYVLIGGAFAFGNIVALIAKMYNDKDFRNKVLLAVPVFMAKSAYCIVTIGIPFLAKIALQLLITGVLPLLLFLTIYVGILIAVTAFAGLMIWLFPNLLFLWLIFSTGSGIYATTKFGEYMKLALNRGYFFRKPAED